MVTLPEYGPAFPGMDGTSTEQPDEPDDKPIHLPPNTTLSTSSNLPTSRRRYKRPASTDSPHPTPPAPLPSTTLPKKTDGSLTPEKAWLEAHTRPTVTLTSYSTTTKKVGGRKCTSSDQVDDCDAAGLCASGFTGL